ncbi:hypothetical protein BDY19DRAFT_900392 [Irpex rosettiformis]|uniref:Uncharacterized protein n=1 Tax=Irpex rosettiformis TaxID=378272 RepID=A0ACB8TN06_9APHY|nr:hypothetical protein BDY19DRAFT_900392 [Irpex rosettiformis]
MAPPTSNDLKRRIVSWYFIEKRTEAWISRHANVSVGLVSKVVNNYRRHGDVSYPLSHSRGRQSTLDDGDLQYIRAVFQMRGTSYLDELQTKLQTVRGVHISLATLHQQYNRHISQ